VLDYTAYALTGNPSGATAAGWVALFDFDRLYRQPAVTGATIISAAGLIASDSTVRAAWQLNYAGGRPGQAPTNANWHGYWCAIRNLEGPAYTACSQATQPNVGPQP